MPASLTITAFYSFSPLTTIYSSQVNNNFSLFRGHLLAIDGSSSSFANNFYDLGSSSYRWRYSYADFIPSVVSTTGSYTLLSTDSVLLSNCTGATTTVTLPTISSVPVGKTYVIKHVGTANTVLIDGNGSETIDGSITSALIDSYESKSLVSNGSSWFVI